MYHTYNIEYENFPVLWDVVIIKIWDHLWIFWANVIQKRFKTSEKIRNNVAKFSRWTELKSVTNSNLNFLKNYKNYLSFSKKPSS